MTSLDETGLAAAEEAVGVHLVGGPITRDDVAAVLTAYLAAVRTSDALRDLQRLGQECEPDRLALVTNERGGIAATLMLPGARPTRAGWEALERSLGATAPFRRQIVRCHLLRPEPVGEVVGSVRDA